jgi:hypothetical protein
LAKRLRVKNKTKSEEVAKQSAAKNNSGQGCERFDFTFCGPSEKRLDRGLPGNANTALRLLVLSFCPQFFCQTDFLDFIIDYAASETGLSR